MKWRGELAKNVLADSGVRERRTSFRKKSLEPDVGSKVAGL